MSLHIEEKVEKRVITYVPPSVWSSYLSGKPDVPPSDLNADEKTEWERQKREYHQPKVRKSDLIAKKNETERIRDLQKKENDLREEKVIEEKVENFKKRCPEGNSFDYRRIVEIEYKVENFKKLYPEGKERNDYITKIRQDYLNLLRQTKTIYDKYTISGFTGANVLSPIVMRELGLPQQRGYKCYGVGQVSFSNPNHSTILKTYTKKRDDLLEPIQSKIKEQTKLMEDINKIYFHMGYNNSIYKPTPFQTYPTL